LSERYRRRVMSTTSRVSVRIGEASSADVHQCDQCACRQDGTTMLAASRQPGWCTADSGSSRNRTCNL